MSYSSKGDFLGKGIKEYNNGHFKEAVNYLSEVLENEPNNVEAIFYLANSFHARGEIGKAIKAFHTVLKLDPGHTDAAISLSVLYNDIGKYEEGKKVFVEANDRVKKNISGNGIQDRHINKKFAERHFELADLYFTYGRYDESLFEYNKVLGLDPENLDVRVNLAKVYSRKGFVSKAFEELKKLLNEYPHFLKGRIALGVLYYANGKILEAQGHWENVLAKDPYNREASMYLNLSKTATETSIN